MSLLTAENFEWTIENPNKNPHADRSIPYLRVKNESNN
jgi:hypothetical protein